VMEYWSVGVLRQWGIAPRVRGVEDAFRAILGLDHPGLKPWAILLDHFMVKRIDRDPPQLAVRG
jgi:hypothetical protein